jgi:hypothetical protein
MVLVNPHRRVQLLHARYSLALLGRGIQAACRIDPTLRQEASEIPTGTTITLVIGENGPAMTMHKGSTRLMYLGDSSSKKFTPAGLPNTAILRARSLREALLLLKYQDTPVVAISKGRVSIEGAVTLACRFLRILNLTQIYLLPKSLACQVVKRYQAPPRLPRGKFLVYTGLLFDKRGKMDDSL